MTSFIAKTCGVIAHQPETVSAVFSTSRPIMNCSACPVLLSNDEDWTNLTYKPFGAKKEEALLLIFANFSDTMQFTKKLNFVHKDLNLINDKVLKHLVDTKRYFTSTLQHITPTNMSAIDIICNNKFRNLRMMDLRHCRETLTNTKLQLMCKSLTLLESLDLEMCQKISSEGLSFLSNLTSLEHFRIRANYIGSIASIFPNGSKRLKKLELDSVAFKINQEATFEKFDDDNNNDQQCEPLLPSLTYLSLSQTGVTERTFEHLLIHAPNLSVLEISMATSSILEAISELTSLKSLGLFHCENALTKHTILTLIKNLRQLESLHIHCSSIDDESLKIISETAAPLRALHLERNNRFTDRGFGDLITSLKSLEKLRICSCCSPFFSGVLIQQQGEEGRGFSSASSRLSELHLEQTTVQSNGLNSILQPLSLIAKLNLSYTEITSSGLATAVARTKQSIVELNLRGCKGITDLIFLKEGMDALKVLNLSSISSLNFEKMMMNGTGFDLCPPDLEELDLSDCKQIEDFTVVEFPLLFCNLKKLNLASCGQLTNLAITDGICKLTTLQYLNIDTRTITHFKMETVEKHIVGKVLNLKELVLMYEWRRIITNDIELKKKFGHLIEEVVEVDYDDVLDDDPDFFQRCYVGLP